MVARPKIDRQVMRAHNRAVVLDAVRRSGPLARTEVARRTSLAKPTVSAIVDELLAEGLVLEVGVGKSTAAGGRPPTYLDLDVTRDAYVGVHIGVYETTVALADGRGHDRRDSAAGSRRSGRRRARSRTSPRSLDDALAEARIAQEDDPARDDRGAGPRRSRHRRVRAGAEPRLDRRSGGQAVRRRPAHPGDRVEHAARVGVRGSAAGRRARRGHVRVALRRARRRQCHRAGRCARDRHPGLRRRDRPLPGRRRRTAVPLRQVRLPRDVHLGRRHRRRRPRGRRAVTAAHADVSTTSCAPRATATTAHDACSTTPATCSASAPRTSSASSTPELVVVGGEAADAFDFLLDPLRGALAQDALEAEQVPVVASGVDGDAGVAGAVLLAFEAGVASAEVDA